jgi:16S rRNA (cytosine1407-C5)-methyltransferase
MKPVIEDGSTQAASNRSGSTPGLPEQFLARLSEILDPNDLESVLATFSLPRNASFHVNTLKSSPGEVIEMLARSGIQVSTVPGLDGAYWVAPEAREKLLASDATANGAVYSLNASSLLPGLVLDPQPGECVLDLAAAPGGKTHHIACLMHNQGVIVAVEVVRGRYYRLKANMDRLGATIVKPVRADGTSFWRRNAERFDRVLLDAPCSTEGRFSTADPETTRYWSTRKIREMSRKQSRLLYSAFQSLRPGGTLVYATCSFSPEENEFVVARLLRQFDDKVEVLATGLEGTFVRPGLRRWRSRNLPEALEKAVRILPDAHREGFFICRLRKTASIKKPLDRRRRGRT